MQQEFELKRELRRLREEDIKMINQRKKNQRLNRKMDIIQKEHIVSDNLNNLKKQDEVFNAMKM